MKNIVLSVLEDDPAHIFVIQSTLKTLFKDIKFSLAKNGRELMELMPANRPDRLIADINLPVLNGIESLKLIRANPSYDYLPIIMFSSSDKESVRAECFRYGADDYYVKPSEDLYGKVIGEILSKEYPKRNQYTKPQTLPSLLAKTETVSKDSNWADLDDLLGDL